MSTINIEKACAFTGHRILPNNFDVSELKSVIENLIDSGYNTFLCGMALGFDMLCFSVLLELKKYNDIRLIACVPCNEQSKFFTKTQAKEYNNLIGKADEVVILSEDYYDGCMQKRNRFMVDNSSVLVAYLRTNHGGTYSTIKYAVENDRKIIYVNK